MATKEDILDAISEMTVIELKELLDAFEEKFGVTAAAPVAVAAAAGAPAGGAAAEVEEKDDFDVVLTAAGLSAGLLAFLFALSPITKRLLGSVELNTDALITSVAVLTIATLVAGLVPGIRAARLDPIRALRTD